jgi:hypothetical protein
MNLDDSDSDVVSIKSSNGQVKMKIIKKSEEKSIQMKEYGI